MDTRNHSDVDVIQHIQRILGGEERRACDEDAARLLAGTKSLPYTRLFPESVEIRGAAIDGAIVGTVGGDGGRRIATRTTQRVQVADWATVNGTAVACCRPRSAIMIDTELRCGSAFVTIDMRRVIHAPWASTSSGSNGQRRC